MVAVKGKGGKYCDFFFPPKYNLRVKTVPNKFFLPCFTQNYWKNELVSEHVTDLDSGLKSLASNFIEKSHLIITKSLVGF